MVTNSPRSWGLIITGGTCAECLKITNKKGQDRSIVSVLTSKQRKRQWHGKKYENNEDRMQDSTPPALHLNVERPRTKIKNKC